MKIWFIKEQSTDLKGQGFSQEMEGSKKSYPLLNLQEDPTFYPGITVLLFLGLHTQWQNYLAQSIYKLGTWIFAFLEEREKSLLNWPRSSGRDPKKSSAKKRKRPFQPAKLNHVSRAIIGPRGKLSPWRKPRSFHALKKGIKARGYFFVHQEKSSLTWAFITQCLHLTRIRTCKCRHHDKEKNSLFFSFQSAEWRHIYKGEKSLKIIFFSLFPSASRTVSLASEWARNFLSQKATLTQRRFLI